jgi:hypothetical protein
VREQKHTECVAAWGMWDVADLARLGADGDSDHLRGGALLLPAHRPLQHVGGGRGRVNSQCWRDGVELSKQDMIAVVDALPKLKSTTASNDARWQQMK